MSYNYADVKRRIFTEDGQRDFLAMRDNVQRLCKEAGAVRMQEAWNGVATPDSWFALACLDRMVELGELIELEYPGGELGGQYRVFVLKIRTA